jgi:hypothetical protein
MGQINIHNYEAYLLDFSEGNLTNELQVELELFLIQHPEIDINLSELSLIAIDEEAITYSNKSSLKKTEGDLISETQFIAYIENQLPENEKLELENSCSVNPSLSKELALFKKTIAVADSSIIYENKNELKRKPKVIWFDFSVIRYAAAACVLFLIGVFFLWPSENTTHTTIASQENTKVSNNNKPVLQNTVALNNMTNQTEDIIKAQNNIIKKPSKLLANQLTNNKTGNPIEKDSSKQSPTIIANHTEEPRIALHTYKEEQSSNNTIIQVITENDEDFAVATSEKKKTGIWAAASRALKNLNHVGVKSVNGNEEERKSESSYALTLGGVSITHKAGL